jgi:bacterioferritin-associated ferredoxin
MYVCICAAVTERQVRDAVRDGVRTLDHLQATLGVGAGCGCCREFAREVLAQASAEIACGFEAASRLAVPA